jgi:hypothetical protein
MTLGNMRENGMRSLAVSCWICHHGALLSADPWPDDVPVPAFGPCMVCTRCGIIGADARPNWKEGHALRGCDCWARRRIEVSGALARQEGAPSRHHLVHIVRGMHPLGSVPGLPVRVAGPGVGPSPMLPRGWGLHRTDGAAGPPPPSKFGAILYEMND